MLKYKPLTKEKEGTMKKLFILILCGLFLVIVSKVKAKESIYTSEGMMQGTTINKTTDKWCSQQAHLSMFEVNDCKYYDLFLSVWEGDVSVKIGTGKPGKASGNRGNLYIYFEDFCTGSRGHGEAEFEASTFDIDKKLDSAYVEGTGTLYTWEWEGWDDTSPDYIVDPISIKVTWTGTRGVYKGRSTYQDRTRTYRYTSRSTGSSRDAQATGSITGNMTAIEIFDPYAYIATGCDAIMRMEKIHKNK